MYTKYLLLAAIFLFVLPAKISKGSTYKTESEVTKNIQEKQIIENNSKIIKDFVDQHSEHNHQQHDEKQEELEYHFNRIPECKYRKWICMLIHLFWIVVFEVVVFFSFPIPDKPLWFRTSELHSPGVINKELSPSLKMITSVFDNQVQLPVHFGPRVFSTYVYK